MRLLGNYRCLLCYLAAALFGCGRYAAAEGTVTLDGQPLAEATVTFMPVENKGKGGPQPASYITDSEGRFALESPPRYKGALPGTYKVLVSKKVFPPNVPPAKSMEEFMVLSERMIESLPPIYTQKESTPLEVEITSGGKTDIQLDLKSKP